MASQRLPALFTRADEAARAVARLPPRGALASAMRAVRRSEVVASTALAGSRLTPAEVDALLDHGRAQGNHRFSDYLLVLAYAGAADWIAGARALPAGDPRPLLSVDELRQLNARATAGLGLRGGAWRQANLAPDGGIVAPAAWLVAREVTTLVDRFGRGPQGGPVAPWLARFMGRITRLRPFEAANGRTGRLAANLMLRRLDFPPLVFEQRDRAKFRAAVAAAEASEPDALATLFAGALVRTCNRLSAAAGPAPETLMSLREAAGNDYVALAKAAQRGRLRTIIRGGRYFTTAAWIADYRSGRQRLSSADAPLPQSAGK